VELSVDRFREAILFLIAFVLSVTVHEFGHAWTANRFGDPLPRAQGRLTLNPVRHVDPIGTLLLPLILILSSGMTLGWGRPVLTNPKNYVTRFSRGFASLLVAVAGPAMNLVLALVVSVLIVLGVRGQLITLETATVLVQKLVLLNIFLLFLNLLPVPPLDGGALLEWVAPRSMQGVLDFLQRWGFLILFGVLLIPSVRDFVFAPASLLSDVFVRAIQGALH
jgi:Zn-dependent protease